MGNDNFFRTLPLALDAINGLTLAAGVTQSADFTPFYSASAGNVQKALITNMFGGFTSAVGGTGYIRLPSGFIAQWTVATSSSTPAFVTWPVAFPTRCVTWFAQATNQVAAVSTTANTSGATHSVASGTPAVIFFGLGF